MSCCAVRLRTSKAIRGQRSFRGSGIPLKLQFIQNIVIANAVTHCGIMSIYHDKSIEYKNIDFY